IARRGVINLCRCYLLVNDVQIMYLLMSWPGSNSILPKSILVRFLAVGLQGSPSLVFLLLSKVFLSRDWCIFPSWALIISYFMRQLMSWLVNVLEFVID